MNTLTNISAHITAITVRCDTQLHAHTLLYISHRRPVTICIYIRKLNNGTQPNGSLVQKLNNGTQPNSTLKTPIFTKAQYEIQGPVLSTASQTAKAQIRTTTVRCSWLRMVSNLRMVRFLNAQTEKRLLRTEAQDYCYGIYF